MRIKLRTIEDGRRGPCRVGVSCFSFMAFATYLLAASNAEAQETVTIGARAPAVEVNENAVYYNAPVRLRPETELPLFNPVEDNLESRVMDLSGLNRSRALSISADKSSTFESNKTLESRVVKLPPIQRPPAEVTSKIVNAPPIKTHTPRAISSKEESVTAETNAEVVAPKPREIQPSTVNATQSRLDPPSTNVGNREPLVPSPPNELKSISDEDDKPELAAIAPTTTRNEAEVTPLPAISAESLTVLFASADSTIEDSNKAALQAIAATTRSEDRTRLQLKAYASAQDSSASAARRLSLSRALAVRSFLIESGVSSTRIDVRALGAKSESGPPDRVDLVVVH